MGDDAVMRPIAAALTTLAPLVPLAAQAVLSVAAAYAQIGGAIAARISRNAGASRRAA